MSHRPLRIQFVLTSLPVGGAETLLLNMLKRIDRRNYAPQVVCLKEAGALGPEVSQLCPLHTNLLNSKWDVAVLPRLTRLFRSQQADAVVTIGAGDKMFWGRLAAWFAKVPVVCSALHSTGWPDGVGRLNRCLTSITDAFIAVAQDHAEFMRQHEKFPADRVVMIPNGVDTQRFYPDTSMRGWLREQLGLSDDVPLIGIVAALRPEKNHRQFVDAAKCLLQSHPETHFVVVGEGPERSSIQAYIEACGVVDRFHLLGNRSDTPQILAGLDLFCLTSRNEANPVSILEALACCVPVIAPDVGSIRQTVIDGKTGYLTRPLDAEDTADKLRKLLDLPLRSKTMGLQGRELVVGNWGLERMVEGYQSLIGTLYNQHARRHGLPLWQAQSETQQVEDQSADQAVDETLRLPAIELITWPSVPTYPSSR